MLSKRQILACLGRSIVIHPFEETRLRGAVYNLSIGEFVWCRTGSQNQKEGIYPLLPIEEGGPEINEQQVRYDIPPGALVSILTRENVYVDQTIAGLFHSKVDMVTKGFSHISTTLDPGWIGPLLITMVNNSRSTLSIFPGETFVKLSLYRLEVPAGHIHNNPPGRRDRLEIHGLHFPKAKEDYLDNPQFHNPDELTKAFWASSPGKSIARAVRDRVLKITSVCVVLAGVSSLGWLPRVWSLPITVVGAVAAVVIAAGLAALVKLYIRPNGLDDE